MSVSIEKTASKEFIPCLDGKYIAMSENSQWVRGLTLNPINLSAGVVVVATGLLVPFSPIPLALPWGLFYAAPVSIAGLSVAISKKSRTYGMAAGVLAVAVLLVVIVFAAWAASSSQIGSLWGVRDA